MLLGRAPVARITFLVRMVLSLRRDPYSVVVYQSRLSLNVLYFVLTQEEGHSFGITVHHLATALYRFGIVDAEVIETESKLFGPVKQRENFGVLQKGLAGDASPVETHAPQLITLDYSGFQP